MKLTADNFKKYTIREEISTRGGGVEINLTPFGFNGHKMTAYQNYLGGGLLGRICSDNTYKHENKIMSEEEAKKLDEIALELKKYFHSLTNHSDIEFENQTFEKNQLMPISAY